MTNEELSIHKLAMDAACGTIAILEAQLTSLSEAYEDLVHQVETQLFYLDAQETGPFDPTPLMLRKADNDVRKSLEKVKKLLARDEEHE